MTVNIVADKGIYQVNELADGDAVQEVVRNHQVVERVQHNGAWGSETILP